jgi:hypothetical protein
MAMPALRRAIVATTDFATPGHLYSIDLATRVATSVGNTGEDPVLRAFGGKLLLVNRFGATNADNIQPLDAMSFMGPQYSTGNGSNPQDVACVTLERCYVAALATGALPILNLGNGMMVGALDLAALDPDGAPNPSSVYVDGNRLLVSIGRLDPMFMPRGVGQIAVFDAATAAPQGVVDLATANPGGFLVKNPAVASEYCVSTSGDFSGTVGGIECVSFPASGPPVVRMLASAMSLGGYVSGFTLSKDGTKGWAGVNISFMEAQLIEFDARTGMKLRRLGTATRITDVALNDRNELYVADGTMGASGIRVFDATTGMELTTAPISLAGVAPAFQGGLVFLP